MKEMVSHLPTVLPQVLPMAARPSYRPALEKARQTVYIPVRQTSPVPLATANVAWMQVESVGMFVQEQRTPLMDDDRRIIECIRQFLSSTSDVVSS